MTMSTQTLRESARQLAAAVLLDSLQIMNVGDPVTTGFVVTRELTEAGEPVAGLVQGITLENAVESLTATTFSVKVAQGTVIKAGQAVKVLACVMEPDLVGKVVYLDKVSKNGLAMIRKAVGRDFEVVNQEGKGDLA